MHPLEFEYYMIDADNAENVADPASNQSRREGTDNTQILIDAISSLDEGEAILIIRTV